MESEIRVRLLSVVIPLFDEAESVTPLVESVRNALDEYCQWELVLVDDGSTDETAAVASRLAALDRRVSVIRLARNYGQTLAMQAGFDHARGAVVVSMDGDLQNDARDIPRLSLSTTTHPRYRSRRGLSVNG